MDADDRAIRNVLSWSKQFLTRLLATFFEGPCAQFVLGSSGVGSLHMVCGTLASVCRSWFVLCEIGPHNYNH